MWRENGFYKYMCVFICNFSNLIISMSTISGLDLFSFSDQVLYLVSGTHFYGHNLDVDITSNSTSP